MAKRLASATQVNVFVSQALASLEQGAKSWLYAADRLYQLPLGVIGVAIGVALLPRLARAVASQDIVEESTAIDEGVNLSMAFTLPAAAALLAMPFFLMHGFWTGGVFHDSDARNTADALFQYGWGVPAFVLLRILAPPFYARQDMRRPMIFALVGVVLNVAVGAGAFFLLRSQGHPGFVGLAVGTSIAAWSNVLLLAFTLLRERVWRPSADTLSRLLRVIIASAIMAAALGFMSAHREEIVSLVSHTLHIRLGAKELAVAVVCLIGATIYVVAALAVGAIRPRDFITAFRRPAGAAPTADLPMGGDA